MTNPKSAFQRFTSTSDRRVGNKLIKAILDKGWKVSVFDGEEFTLKHSSSAKDIRDALATSGEDTLRIRDKDKTVLGSVFLIWDNGEESPICDYSDNPFMNEVVEMAES